METSLTFCWQQVPDFDSQLKTDEAKDMLQAGRAHSLPHAMSRASWYVTVALCVSGPKVTPYDVNLPAENWTATSAHASLPAGSLPPGLGLAV